MDLLKDTAPPARQSRRVSRTWPAVVNADKSAMLLSALLPLFIGFCILSAAVSTGPWPWFWTAAGTVSVAAAGLFFCRQIRKLRQERHGLDDQLFQSQKLAALGEMAAGIAHEINTPLAIIGQEAEWMEHLLYQEQQTGEPLPRDEFKNCLGQVNAQVHRCAEITHGILGFAARRKAVEQPVDINRLTDDMVRWIEREARQRNIRIIRDYDKRLPEISTDSPLLRQVLLNLLNNAYQAVDQDGTITVFTRANGRDSVSIEVRDSGCGIAPENLGKIFNPFFTTKSPGKGTGLGLSISLSIVNRLGGTITVDSKLGEGTAFTINLPKSP